ncbi:DUF805 domain-containing protein [Telmatospirillum sp. J64-1]|uniref:DUF805 domain-containing protein n=1 Tax=Telmatospirillum sp. J64-1 TaxID=2502183 RepID=UPI00115F215E|nr:DUF805 domain-containing protein [Telmatospirillum sp. J64-1]
MMGPDADPGAVSWFPAIFGFVFLVLAVWANIQILRKAGRSAWWALLMLFPLAYFIGVWIFAFSRWPREDQVASARDSFRSGDQFRR